MEPVVRLRAHGIDVDVPRGWDGEIYRPSTGFTAQGVEGGSTPVMHLSNSALPPVRGDFGSGAVELLRSDNVFLVLVEYDRSSANRSLFSTQGMPQVRAEDFAPDTMQHPVQGQSGAQYFFNTGGRAFCLYVVLGSHARRNELVPEINQVLDTLTLDEG
ncbi:MAG: hypothetical protein L0Z49_03645 [Actinobacteria bacterium]|nr:hypothetical protein [Actinomycetota bacterium]